MEWDTELQLILQNERRWTPTAFDKFGVTANGLVLYVPFWGDSVAQSRSYDFKIADHNARRKSPSGCKAKLFGDLNIEAPIIFEGESDLFCAFEHGITNGICITNGAQSFSRHMASELAGKRVTIIFDADEPGTAGAKKTRDLLLMAGCCVRLVDLSAHLKSGKDVRDFLTICGGTAKDLRQITELFPWENSIPKGKEVLQVRRVSDIVRKEVECIWEPRVIRRAVTIIAGEPGVGKSFLTAFIAAKITSRLPSFDLSGNFEHGKVMICNLEDDPENTIKARIEDAGADQNMVYHIDSKISLNNDESVDQLRKVIERIKPLVIILDPIASFVGAETNTNSFNEVREVMEVPIALARDYDLAVVCVMHTNKGDSPNFLNRIMGSMDFVAAVRSVMLVLKHPSNEKIKLLGHIKHNLTARAPTLLYEITDGKMVSIVGADDRPIEQIYFAAAAENKNKSALVEAVDFLQDMLRDGPVKSAIILGQASDLGISKSTLKRARTDLGTAKKKITYLTPEKNQEVYWIMMLKEQVARWRNIGHLGLVEHWKRTGSPKDQEAQEDKQDQQNEHPVTGDSFENNYGTDHHEKS